MVAAGNYNSVYINPGLTPEDLPPLRNADAVEAYKAIWL